MCSKNYVIKKLETEENLFNLKSAKNKCLLLSRNIRVWSMMRE